MRMRRGGNEGFDEGIGRAFFLFTGKFCWLFSDKLELKTIGWPGCYFLCGSSVLKWYCHLTNPAGYWHCTRYRSLLVVVMYIGRGLDGLRYLRSCWDIVTGARWRCVCLQWSSCSTGDLIVSTSCPFRPCWVADPPSEQMDGNYTNRCLSHYVNVCFVDWQLSFRVKVTWPLVTDMISCRHMPFLCFVAVLIFWYVCDFVFLLYTYWTIMMDVVSVPSMHLLLLNSQYVDLDRPVNCHPWH